MGEDAPRVGIIMGSQSDWSTLRNAAETLETLGVAHETRIVSAHRTPRRMVDYASGARDRGLKVIIAGAPVGTLAIGRAGAVNAALLAAAVIALEDPRVAAALDDWRARQTEAVAETPGDDA
jgi:5-(carboxyamino)imidazole ribonucleotide mutase